MKTLRMVVLVSALSLALAACNSDDADITTTTADASQLTTTTTTAGGTSGSDTTSPDATGGPDTTAAPADAIESHEIISRLSTPDGETLYILVPPGEYSDVSIENFLGDLLEDEDAVSSVEVFDDRVALDAALKDEADRTAAELQAIEDHHLVTLVDRTQVQFQGPMGDFDDFVIGS